jgi:Ca2+-binding RTX toxin-like protein
MPSPTLDFLTQLNGQNGFRLNGVSENAFTGQVSGAGDINGDGFDDLLIGAQSTGTFGSGGISGTAYVIFGKAGSFSADLNLGNLNGLNGFQIEGQPGDAAGADVQGAGDVNGDGFDDIIIGAPVADRAGQPTTLNSGRAYVVFGKAAGFGTTLSLSLLDGINGFQIEGIDGGLGGAVSHAGDINGDGFADVIIGASGASAGGTSSGESYVVFGKASGFPPILDMATLNGVNGFRLRGDAETDGLGISVSSAGDMNGDGLDDLIVGAHISNPGGSNRKGEIYVVFGKTTPFNPIVNLSALNGSDGFRLEGVEDNDFAGTTVSDLGDMNGDGLDDILIGATGVDADGIKDAGAAYVIFGSDRPFPASISLTTLNGTDGFRIDGVAVEDRVGLDASGIGDINADGFNDLILGARTADPNGRTFILYGRAQGFGASVNLSDLNGINGFVLDPEPSNPNGFFGVSAQGVGDIDGDGFADVMIGDSQASPNGVNLAGATYAIFGDNFTNAVTRIGTANNDTLTGTAGADIINGAQGNDVLQGNGGADILLGGNGNDILAVQDTAFRKLQGGNGIDTLSIESANVTLNLTSLPDNRIQGIEVIDINGTGTNVLALNVREVLRLSDHSNTVVVQKGNDDVVQIGGGWRQEASEIIDNIAFDVFTQGAAVLKISQAPDLTGATGTALSPILFRSGKRGERLIGTNRNDRLRGTRNKDVLKGRGGNDRLNGRDGSDKVLGGRGNDKLNGGNDNDRVSGGGGNDIVRGKGGRDLLRGGRGNDRLVGNRGSDVLIGDAGDDILIGGSGKNTFQFNNPNHGVDVIRSFNGSNDLIDVSNILKRPQHNTSSPFDAFTDFIQLIQLGTDTEVRIDRNGQGTEFVAIARLQNVGISALSSENFIVA